MFAFYMLFARKHFWPVLRDQKLHLLSLVLLSIWSSAISVFCMSWSYLAMLLHRDGNIVESHSVLWAQRCQTWVHNCAVNEETRVFSVGSNLCVYSCFVSTCCCIREWIKWQNRYHRLVTSSKILCSVNMSKPIKMDHFS